MSIEIKIYAETAEQARQEMSALLGEVSVAIDLSEAPITRADVAAAADFISQPQPIMAEEPEELKVEEPAPKKRGRKPKASSPDMIVDEPKPAISTGEARAGPEDSPETQEQDAADEAAESAATKPAHLTHDDVRHELGVYVRTYGMDAATEDFVKLYELVFPGKGILKTTDIPDDQESLNKALAGLRGMIAKNPYERTPAGA